MKDTPSQKNLFTGSLDLDNEARSVKENDYTYALNIRNSVSRDGTDKQVLKMRGNELVPLRDIQGNIINQPDGTNKCIGQFENLATRLNYSFVYNLDPITNERKMQIRENNIDTLTVTPVAEYDFKWLPDKFISNIDLVDNKLLLWTDTKPRRINIEKSREDKNFKGNIYFASANTIFTLAGTTFTLSILDKNNIVIAIAAFTTGIPLTRKQTADFLTFFINNNNDLSPLCTATACQEYIEIEFTQQGYFQFSVTATNNVQSIYVPQNYYYQITDTIIDAGKYPLNCPPTLQIKQDAKREGFNNIERTTWQFATQVIYDDFDESTLSPYSDIAFINCSQRGNYIEVDFTDPRLNNPTDLSIISKVRLLARPNNTGKFREIVTIEQSELWANSGTLNSNTFRFYNDGQYTIIDDATATLPYSALPIEVVGDKYDMGEENFDNRVGYSKFIENYEAPCMEASLTADFTENDEFVCTVLGQVLILNTEQFQSSPSATSARGWHRSELVSPTFNFGLIGVIHQTQNDTYPVFGGARTSNVLTDISSTSEQILPEGGFPIYFAGTEYLALSKQEQTLANINYNPSGAINTSSGTLINQLRDWYVDYNNNPNGRGTPVSSWKMQGVKAGTHVVRVASHLCSFNDVLGKGVRYDLYNNNLYQTTSTYLKGINVWNPNANDFFAFEDSFEVVLEINSNSTYSLYRNNQILINNQPIVNGELFLGQMWIEDLSLLRTDFSGGLNFYAGSSFSGYLIDADASLSASAVKFGLAMERQKVTLIADVAPDPLNPMTIGDRYEQDRTTDHNGFIYGSYFQTNLDGAISYRFLSQSVTGGTAQPLVSRNATTEYFYNDISIYNAIDTSSATFGFILDSNFPIVILDRKHRQLFLPNINQQVTLNARTLLKGRIVNSSGQGVQGITIIYGRTGRVEKTQADGTYSIIVYGAFNETNSRTDLLILSSCCDCIYEFALANQPYWYNSIQITPFGTTYTNTNPFNLINIVADLLATLSGRKLKSGGRYNFALFHVDDLNRRHALVTNNLEVAIPFTTEQRQDYFDNVGTGNSNGVFEFTLNVTSDPPIWADKLYVVRTQDTYYSDFLQFPLYDAKYVVQYDDENSIPIETTFSTFSANEIYLGFTEATVAYKEFNSASLKGWDFQEGDRVRFISKPSGELYDKLYDLPIKAQRTDSTTEFIYFAIDNLDALGEVTAGTLVEVYRPKKDLDDNVELYFEIHTCIDIVEVNGQKQYVGLPLKLNTGDTYSRNRTVPITSGISSNFIEDNSISDNWASRQQDIGRVVVKDTRFGRLIRENAIKFSNQYIPGSKINGLSRFEPLNEFEYPRQYGSINKLIMVNDNADVQVLMAVCENNSFVVYIREVIYNDVRGTETVSVADRVLGSFRTLKGDYGTKNPESFAFRDGQIFWWDVNRGAFIRYDNNGVDDVSSLNTLQYAININSNTNVISAYDDFYSEFITYPMQEKKDAIGFLSDKRGWNGFYSFKPEILGTSAEFILSWKDGNLYLHDSPNVPYCNFYGQQFDSRITFVSKLSPLGLKVAQNMRVKASQVWEALSIKTVPNAMYKQGMLSRIKRGNWKNFEGDFWASVLRNINDPRFTDPNQAVLKGEPMRGDAFIVELMNDSEDLQSLRMAEMYYFSSENTNG